MNAHDGRGPDLHAGEFRDRLPVTKTEARRFVEKVAQGARPRLSAAAEAAIRQARKQPARPPVHKDRPLKR
jgi:hypothetical protein